MNAKVNLKKCGSGAGGAPYPSAVAVMVRTARASRDWSGVLRWESRLEELLLTLDEVRHPQLIFDFADTNFHRGHYAKAASLFQRRVQLLGKMERFREQGVDMCRVGECFVSLNDAKGADTWYQKARTLAEKHGCYELEGRACLGLGRVELYMRGRMQEAEELLRHALSVLDFVEGKDETFERDIKKELATVLMLTDRYEEAGPLIPRLRKLAERAWADPFERVQALDFAVRFQLSRADVEQALTEMQVLPSDPISHPPRSDSRNPDPTSHLRHKPQPSGRRNPSGVHLFQYNPRRSVGAARFARPRFLAGVRPGVDWRGVGWFQALEEAFQRAGAVQKARFEPELQRRRAMVLSMKKAGTLNPKPQP